MAPRWRRAISALLFSCATVLLLAAFVAPYAFYSETSGDITESAHFYAGAQFRLVCTGSGCYSGWTSTDNYGQAMADLYTVVWWLLVGGVFLSFWAAILALIGALGRRTALLSWMTAVLGFGFAILGPLTVLLVQPTAYSTDLTVPRLRAYYLV